MEAGSEGGSAVPGLEGEPGSAARSDRLKEAIRLVGNARDLSRLSGVAYGTIQNYSQGGELKLSNAVAIAKAAGVRLDWLATGEGPMTGDGPPPASPVEAARGALARSQAKPGLAEPHFEGADQAGLGITWEINIDRLARAYELAMNGIATLPGHRPDTRRLLQVTLLFYDEMTEAEGAAKPPSSPPLSGA